MPPAGRSPSGGRGRTSPPLDNFFGNRFETHFLVRNFKNCQQQMIRRTTLFIMVLTKCSKLQNCYHFEARFPKNTKSEAISKFASRESFVVSAVLWSRFVFVGRDAGSCHCAPSPLRFLCAVRRDFDALRLWRPIALICRGDCCRSCV